MKEIRARLARETCSLQDVVCLAGEAIAEEDEEEEGVGEKNDECLMTPPRGEVPKPFGSPEST